MADVLQVKMEVLDEDDRPLETWALPIGAVRHGISRTPISISIPSARRDSDGQPSAYSIDFGMMSEILTFAEGVSVDGTMETVEGEAPRPTHAELANVARTSWRTLRTRVAGGIIGLAGGVRVTMNEGDGQGVKRYQGLILSFDADRAGGGTSWKWSMKLQVARWPIEDGVI